MRDLVNGTKELLLTEFKELYPVHGRKWRSLLRKVNAWHSTSTGLEAWKNISNKTTGNEALRLILADMNRVINTQPVETTIRKQGLVRPEAPSLHEKYPAAHRAARKRASHQKANK
jgi:hypothetical protein